MENAYAKLITGRQAVRVMFSDHSIDYGPGDIKRLENEIAIARRQVGTTTPAPRFIRATTSKGL
jgi:hypothetical protein